MLFKGLSYLPLKLHRLVNDVPVQFHESKSSAPVLTEFLPVCFLKLMEWLFLWCRELGLDELLRHCERVVEKLHYPENDSCYQAMAGTALFTHTAFNMLQNYSRYCTV